MEELESKIKADIEKGKVPVAVFVNAGKRPYKSFEF